VSATAVSDLPPPELPSPQAIHPNANAEAKSGEVAKPKMRLHFIELSLSHGSYGVFFNRTVEILG
jgi:hypothetical protein